MDVSPDRFHLHTAIADTLRQRSDGTAPPDPKIAHRVVIKSRVNFSLTAPVHAQQLTAEFYGLIKLNARQETGMGVLSDVHREKISHLRWVLWRSTPTNPVLIAGHPYVFDMLEDLPPASPRTIETGSGSIKYFLKVSLEGVTKLGRMPDPMTWLEVINPMSVGSLSAPRNPLQFGVPPPMDGHSILPLGSSRWEIDVKYPLHAYKGPGCVFPVKLTLKLKADADMKGDTPDITHTTVSLLQTVSYLVNRIPYVFDTYAVATAELPPFAVSTTTTKPILAQLPIPDHRVHGRVTQGVHVRVTHSLRIEVARSGWLKKKVVRELGVKVFQRSIGEELLELPGYMTPEYNSEEMGSRASSINSVPILSKREEAERESRMQSPASTAPPSRSHSLERNGHSFGSRTTSPTEGDGTGRGRPAGRAPPSRRSSLRSISSYVSEQEEERAVEENGPPPTFEEATERSEEELLVWLV
ncbi:hypothetical protein YB2330_003887 [Saitoella coloradoensis]